MKQEFKHGGQYTCSLPSMSFCWKLPKINVHCARISAHAGQLQSLQMDLSNLIIWLFLDCNGSKYCIMLSKKHGHLLCHSLNQSSSSCLLSLLHCTDDCFHIKFFFVVVSLWQTISVSSKFKYSSFWWYGLQEVNNSQKDELSDPCQCSQTTQKLASRFLVPQHPNTYLVHSGLYSQIMGSTHK